MKITDITIGADVEVFVKHKETGEIVSAEGMIKGTKENPFVFDKANPHFATSLDNVLAEFGIPPATSKMEFYNYLRKSLNFINRTLRKEFCVAIQPASILDDKWLQTEQAIRFGCEPDYNAYTTNENPAPKAENPNLRSAGGHIHIGYKTPAFEFKPEEYDKKLPIYKEYTGDPERCDITKAVDLHVGVPNVLMEPWNKRKELYGKAGCFRPKTYGIEYRTISNYYLQDRKLIFWVYDAVHAAIDWYNAGNRVEENLSQYVQYAINYSDKDCAQELINEFKLKLAV